MEERPHGLPSGAEAAEKMQKPVESLPDQRPAIAPSIKSRLRLLAVACWRRDGRVFLWWLEPRSLRLSSGCGSRLYLPCLDVTCFIECDLSSHAFLKQESLGLRLNELFLHG